MSWISVVASLIRAAFPGPRERCVDAPPGLGGARVSYMNQGRWGKVIFTHRMKSFGMYFELGGGDTVATITIPPPAAWTQGTGFPLTERQAILEFIGKSVVRDQTTYGKGRFEVHDEYLSIHVGGGHAPPPP